VHSRFDRGVSTSRLILATVNPARADGPTAQWAHDIRNALATVGLHPETLEQLSGARGRYIAHVAHALMSRAARTPKIGAV
jgi:hypothetical protein